MNIFTLLLTRYFKFTVLQNRSIWFHTCIICPSSLRASAHRHFICHNNRLIGLIAIPRALSTSCEWFLDTLCISLATAFDYFVSPSRSLLFSRLSCLNFLSRCYPRAFVVSSARCRRFSGNFLLRCHWCHARYLLSSFLRDQPTAPSSFLWDCCAVEWVRSRTQNTQQLIERACECLIDRHLQYSLAMAFTIFCLTISVLILIAND